MYKKCNKGQRPKASQVITFVVVNLGELYSGTVNESAHNGHLCMHNLICLHVYTDLFLLGYSPTHLE